MSYSADDLADAVTALDEFEAARLAQIESDVDFLQNLSTPMDRVASEAQDASAAATSVLIDSVRA